MHQENTTPSQKRVRVLLVEDNPGDARLIQEFLFDGNGATFDLQMESLLGVAVKKAKTNFPDVVLLDLSLPDSQGLDSLERARQGFGNIPIVVLTGLNDESVGVRAIQNGAQDYLVKGEVNHTMLTRVLRYAIERHKLAMELKVATENIRILSGLLPICAACKKIRDDKGYWNQIETYIRNHSEASFSHSICPECSKKMYPNYTADRRES